MSFIDQVMMKPSDKATYMGCTGVFNPAASTTDMCRISGSSTKTVRILRILLTYKTTSVTNTNDFYLIKRSAANTGGTTVSTTAVACDSNNAAATAAMIHYTANPTGLGAAVGTIGVLTAVTTSLANSAAGANTFITLFDADKYGQAITLRGTAEGLCINNNGSTVANGGTPSIIIVWTEE